MSIKILTNGAQTIPRTKKNSICKGLQWQNELRDLL